MKLTRRMLLATCAVLPGWNTSARECDLENIGTDNCIIEVDINFHPAKQSKKNWCWAACIQMVFANKGYSVSQERIVRKVFEDETDAGASPNQIADAVDGSWSDANGRNFFADSEVLWDSSRFFAKTEPRERAAVYLDDGLPLIVGALGHATVLTGLQFERGGALRIKVLDPWPSARRQRLLSAEETINTSFLMAINVHQSR